MPMPMPMPTSPIEPTPPRSTRSGPTPRRIPPRSTFATPAADAGRRPGHLRGRDYSAAEVEFMAAIQEYKSGPAAGRSA